MRKSEPLSCRKLIETAAIAKPLEVNEQYRDFRQYMVDYLEVHDAIYSTDQEEAINFPTQMQMGQERRSNHTGFKKDGVTMRYRIWGD